MARRADRLRRLCHVIVLDDLGHLGMLSESSLGKLKLSPSLAMKSSSLPQMMLRKFFFVAGSSSRTT
jgi:hypothetical protein